MKRRNFLKILMSSAALIASELIIPIRAWAKWNENAFSAKNLDSAISANFPNKKINQSNQIKIDVYDEIENGAVVPIKIKTDLKKVKTIAIFVEKNPNPLIANFNLWPNCISFVSTRIKVSEPSNIIVIVNADENLFMTKKFITVHENGCG